MDNKTIEWRREKLKYMRAQLESGQLNAVRELIPDEVIYQICDDCQYYFRTRLLTPLVTVFHMVQAAVSCEGTFQSAWHLTGQSGYSGSLAKARRRLPLEVWEGLHEWAVEQIKKETSSDFEWRGHRMVGIDGTCVSMSETPELVERFGRCHGMHGYSRFPIARATLAFDLKTLVVYGHRIDRYTTSELELLKPMLGKELKPGDVLVADRRFAGANLYAEYRQASLHFITRAHQKLRLERLKIVEVLGLEDVVTELPINRLYRQDNPALPESILVRFIKTNAKVRGRRKTVWIATSLLDSRKYPAHEIQDWYKKRWKVETLIEELKTWMGADVLRSQTAEGIHKELHARMVAFNLIHWLILRAAGKHNHSVEQISVSSALRLTAAYSLKMSTAPCWRLPLLYEELLHHIARSIIPHRPDRIEPRMIRREKKYYPMLKISRHEWRELNAAMS